MHLCGATEEGEGAFGVCASPLSPLFAARFFFNERTPFLLFFGGKGGGSAAEGRVPLSSGSKSGLFRSCEHSPGFPTQGGKKADWGNYFTAAFWIKTPLLLFPASGAIFHRFLFGVDYLGNSFMACEKKPDTPRHSRAGRERLLPAKKRGKEKTVRSEF